MEYIIKIDRKSIGVNPEADKSDLFVPIATRITAQCTVDNRRFTNSELELFHKSRVTRFLGQMSGSSFRECVEMELRDDIELKALNDLCVKNNIHIYSHIENYIDHCHIIGRPQPWLFKYKDRIVKCRDCKASFSYKKLKEREYEDYYNSSVCPKCGVADCCDIVYEDIYEVMRNDSPRLIINKRFT